MCGSHPDTTDMPLLVCTLRSMTVQHGLLALLHNVQAGPARCCDRRSSRAGQASTVQPLQCSSGSAGQQSKTTKTVAAVCYMTHQHAGGPGFTLLYD
jgi:hypothetical protein